MSQGILKLIALIAMLIDHVSAVLLMSGTNIIDYQVLYFGRVIGRMALPIFAFFLVEGFIHTSNLKKYIERVLIIAIISQIPFIYSFYFESTFYNISSELNLSDFGEILVVILGYWAIICDRKFDRSLIIVSFSYLLIPFYYMVSQGQTLNIFYEMATGLIILELLKRAKTPSTCGLNCNSTFNRIVMIITAFIVYYFVAKHANYGNAALILIIILYIFRENNLIRYGFIFLWGYLQYFGNTNMMIAVFITAGLLILYNGNKGKAFKSLYYYIYPIHLVLLSIFNLIIKG